MNESSQECSIAEHSELIEELQETKEALTGMEQSHEHLYDLLKRALPYCAAEAPRTGYDYRMLLNQIDRALFDASMDSLQ